jgi:uncharacterized protein YjiS (DUF1127 family)
MELFMNKFYLATVLAIVITASIGSHLLMVGALGPTNSGFLVSLKSGLSGLFKRIGRFFDGWIAATLAHRERQVAMFALTKLSDRELKDIGLYRGTIARDFFLSPPERQGAAGDTASASDAVRKRR